MSSRLSVRGERRSRSKSPSGRERERSTSGIPEVTPDSMRESSYRRSSKKHVESESESEVSSDDNRRYGGGKSSKKYYESDSDDGRPKRRSSRKYDESDSDDDRHNGKSQRGVAPVIATISPHDTQQPYMSSQANPYAPSSDHRPPGAFPDARPHETRHTSYIGQDPRYAPPPSSANFARPEANQRPRAASSVTPQYANIGQFHYAQVNPQVAHKYGNNQAHVSQYQAHNTPQVTNVDPRLSDSRLQQGYKAPEKKREEYERERPRPNGHEDPSRRLSKLSVGSAAGAATLGVGTAAAHGATNGHSKPPPSPLLEAYTGTYQTISPMPSALVLAGHKDDSDISDVELDSDSGIDDKDPNADIKRKIRRLEKEKEWHQKKREKEEAKRKKEEEERREYERQRPSKAQYESRLPDSDLDISSTVSPRSSRKKVTWYDAESDAAEIAGILKGSKPPNVKPLIKILPHLSIDDLEALKAEYKKHAKIQGQGINMSKHIKARVGGHLGKAAYACSLGQYEGDAFWANCFYQTGASRRELLIESLMGRTNQQIREIKNFFKDKKYDDDLEKCMKAELKADKFRTAILLALEERRMAESPIVDPRLVRDDIEDLYEALNSAGGESAMIKIIVVRSDTHLRETMRMYERTYGRNFARDMISKSRNLVGETLAHILNGALNRSMRDALLLHQAIAETAPGKERAELLISRLVRLHWEPKHLEKVKAQYAERYGIKLADDIRKQIQANMKTEEGLAWTTFCIELIKSSES